jgi:beta-fructofuranosidase
MPRLHFAPPHGWMNDPNGLVHWKGRHHLFFQYNPDAPEFGLMRWGHASSADLLTWQHHPIALEPAAQGGWYDADGCWSGSAVVDRDGAVALLYTGVQGNRQLPCLARPTGDDLLAFTKHARNPVVTTATPADAIAFRDPTVLREGDHWRLLVGGGTESLGGAVFGYLGDDLTHWRPDTLLLDSSRAGIPGEIWECPNLFLDETAVLVVSVLNRTEPPSGHEPRVWYAAGALRGGTLEPAHTDLVDDGDRFYAPQSYPVPDGRRLMIGWICTHLDPAAPRSPALGLMSFPRELTIINSQLWQAPAQELHLLRDEPIVSELPLQAGESLTLPRPLAAFELRVSGPSVAAVELSDTATGHRRTAPLRVPAHDLTLYLDGGVIETFSHGRAATWTNLALTRADRIEVHPGPGNQGRPRFRVTVWPLNQPPPQA